MSNRRFDPETAFACDDNFALVADPAELFGFLKRSLDLPPDWAALVIGADGERTFHRSGAVLDSVEGEDLLFVRTGPIGLEFHGLRALSVDDHECRVDVSFSISAVCEPAELVALRRRLVRDGHAATRESTSEYFQSAVESAVAQCAEGRGVGVLLDAGKNECFSTEVAEVLRGAAFSAGLSIEPPVRVRFDAPVYRQIRAARAAQTRREDERRVQRSIEIAQQEAQRLHSEHLGRLLEQLRAEAEKSPDTETVDLIKAFPEAERGELYTALLVDQPADRTRWIVVGAGPQLLFFEPDRPDAPAKTQEIDDVVGAVRSVQLSEDSSGSPRLLVGAAFGVHEMSADATTPTRTYAVAGVSEVRGGINSATFVGDHLLASHSELGLLCWERGSDDPARRLHEACTGDAQAVRNVHFHDGNVYFTVDNRVLRLRGDRLNDEPFVYEGCRSTITSLCACREGVFAGNADGEVLMWGSEGADAPTRLHVGRRRSAESVTFLNAGGVPRLIYTDTSIAVFARVLGDAFTCRYEAGGQTLKRVEAAPDLLVATNEVRDRLVCWHPGRPAQPSEVISVSQLTGRSIQDVALIPRTTVEDA